MGRVSFWGHKSTLKLDSGDRCATLNIMKTTELHTLKGRILQHMNYISVRKSQYDKQMG